MKSLLTFIATVSLAASAFAAAPSSKQINAEALKIMHHNQSKLATSEGQTLRQVVKSVVYANSTVKESMSCKYDKSDALFNCTLVVIGSDADGESAAIIEVQLERDSKTGLPSKNLLFLTISVQYAG